MFNFEQRALRDTRRQGIADGAAIISPKCHANIDVWV
jgi:hypothetical protein